ncbi:MAG: type II toxin-antitoxin system VapC family toxin [Pseudolabrys sp.]|nr:type II toxin-antitoxin system VapC family toxin [Pseudolabrys sp.]
MIVLDTNIISELMRPEPNARVLAWMTEQPMAGLFTTALTQAEIFYGLAMLPKGRRRDNLLAAAQPMFEVDLAGRVLPFDTDAAWAYPDIAAGRKRAGQPINQIDAQIAAIVRSRGARLATRNLGDFAHCGISVVNPWGEA